MKKLLLLSSLYCALNFVNAEELPKASVLDSKIQEVVYDGHNVTIVKVKAGVATLIQLSDDEFIGGENLASGFAIGDPMAWDISIRQNNIFLRPKANQPDTNVVFTTNKRTYSVILSSVAEEENPTFVLRYKYPQDEALKAKIKKQEQAKAWQEKQRAKVENMAIPCTDGGWINTDYQVRGSSEIKPYHIWDDGIFTCFKWVGNKDLPAVYKQFPNSKKEQLTNYHMKKDVMIIHEVSKNFILRFGDYVMEVKTDRNVNRGFNSKGTTVPNQALINK